MSDAEKWLREVEALPESNLTAAEVLEAIEQAIEERRSDETEYWDDEVGSVPLRIRGEMTQPTVIHNSGGYDDAADRQIVIKVKEQYFMKTGYYTSFDGSDWHSGIREVSPTPKTITEWI